MVVKLEFLRENAPYQAGDRAAFEPERARVLIAAGAARLAPDATAPVGQESALPKKTAVVRHHARKTD